MYVCTAVHILFLQPLLCVTTAGVPCTVCTASTLTSTLVATISNIVSKRTYKSTYDNLPVVIT